MGRYVRTVCVKGIEKRYQPTRCYKFVLEVVWSDSSRYVIYRSFSEFLDIHIQLVEAFPIEAGEIDEDRRILPELTETSLFSRSEVLKVAEKRRAEIAQYCTLLMGMEKKISQFPALLSFFEPRDDDLNVPVNAKVKKSGLKERLLSKILRQEEPQRKISDDFDITGPIQTEVYQAIAAYKSAGKGQISLEKDDQVDVIDKNDNGWWYVSASGQEGWAPATYLDKISGGPAAEGDEIQCMAGELFLSMKSYDSQFEDEISFGVHVVLEVMNKVLDGWWIASYDGQVGYVPSTYLKAYKNEYLNSPQFSQTLPATSIQKPTPRRQSIKTSANTLPSKRDLMPYRRATEKRKQRSIRQLKPSEREVPPDVLRKNDTNVSPQTGTILSDAAHLSQIIEDGDEEDDEDYMIPDEPERRMSASSTDSDYVLPDEINRKMSADYMEPTMIMDMVEPPGSKHKTQPALPPPAPPKGIAHCVQLSKEMPIVSPRKESVALPPRVLNREFSAPALLPVQQTFDCKSACVPARKVSLAESDDGYEPIHDYDQPPELEQSPRHPPPPPPPALQPRSRQNSEERFFNKPTKPPRAKRTAQPTPSPQTDLPVFPPETEDVPKMRAPPPPKAHVKLKGRSKLNVKVPPSKPVNSSSLQKNADGDYLYKRVESDGYLEVSSAEPTPSPKPLPTKPKPAFKIPSMERSKSLQDLLDEKKELGQSTQPVPSAKPMVKKVRPVEKVTPMVKSGSLQNLLDGSLKTVDTPFNNNETSKIYEESLMKPSQLKNKVNSPPTKLDKKLVQVINDTNQNTSDHLIYEEMLVKPSQMKGMSNAAIRKVK